MIHLSLASAEEIETEASLLLGHEAVNDLNNSTSAVTNKLDDRSAVVRIIACYFAAKHLWSGVSKFATPLFMKAAFDSSPGVREAARRWLEYVPPTKIRYSRRVRFWIDRYLIAFVGRCWDVASLLYNALSLVILMQPATTRARRSSHDQNALIMLTVWKGRGGHAWANRVLRMVALRDQDDQTRLDALVSLFSNSYVYGNRKCMQWVADWIESGSPSDERFRKLGYIWLLIFLNRPVVQYESTWEHISISELVDRALLDRIKQNEDLESLRSHLGKEQL